MISGSLTGRMEASSKNKALASVSLGKGLLYCFQFTGMLLHQRKSISVQFQNQFADVKPQDFTGFSKRGAEEAVSFPVDPILRAPSAGRPWESRERRGAP